MRIAAACWALLWCSICSAQSPLRPKAPVPPMETETAERSALNAAGALLVQGQFDAATALLRPLSLPAVSRVYFDWTPVPRALRAGLRADAARAMAAWNAGLGGSVRFTPAPDEDHADLTVLFDRHVSRTETTGPRWVCCDASGARPGPGTVRISLWAPSSETPHTAPALARLVSHALGAYLGLGLSTGTTGVMSPCTHAASGSSLPSPAECASARRLQDVRTRYADWARRKVVVDVPRPVLKVEKETVDVGEVWRGEEASFEFVLSNGGDAPLEIDAHPNCGCTVFDYDRVVPAGGTSRIKARIATQGYKGKIAKTITLAANDPAKPQTTLRMEADVRSVVELSPTEAPVLRMPAGAAGTLDLELRYREKTAVTLKSAQSTAGFVKVESEAIPSGEGVSAHRLHVTASPEAPVGRYSVAVAVASTSTREPQFTFMVTLEKGIFAVPNSLYMGVIGPATALPVTQVAVLSKPQGTFRVLRVRPEAPELEAAYEPLQGGSQARLSVTYRGGWKPGPVSTRVVVETDDPAQREIVVPVIATVLPPK